MNALAQDASGNSKTCAFTVTVLAGSPPQLSMTRSGTNVILSWPDSFYCYSLQSTPGLLPPPATNVWKVLPGPFGRGGGRFFATNHIAGSNQFFRLSY